MSPLTGSVRRPVDLRFRHPILINWEMCVYCMRNLLDAVKRSSAPGSGFEVLVLSGHNLACRARL
jgi:hypothetical protein